MQLNRTEPSAQGEISTWLVQYIHDSYYAQRPGNRKQGNLLEQKSIWETTKEALMEVYTLDEQSLSCNTVTWKEPQPEATYRRLEWPRTTGFVMFSDFRKQFSRSKCFGFCFYSRWHSSALKGPYLLLSSPQKCSQGYLWNSANVCLVKQRYFQTMEGWMPAASFLHSWLFSRESWVL